MRIITENPMKSQWLLLSHFTYQANIENYFSNNKIVFTDPIIFSYISGCIKQAEAYFLTGREAPLDILPLVVYYGTVCLLSGVAALTSGIIPDIKNHGMYLEDWTNQISEIVIHPKDSANGALQLLSNIYSPGISFTNTISWNFWEVISFLPEIRSDFISLYKDKEPNTIPLEQARKANLIFERADLKDLIRIQDIEKKIPTILNYSKSYLDPMITKTHLILYKKMPLFEIGCYSIFGKKHLLIPILKNGTMVSINPLIGYFMGLYVLGILSRYNPEKWFPFTSNDSSGERLLIEVFLLNALRVVPNLVLNFIHNESVQFSFQDEKTTNLSSPIYKEEIEEIVNDLLKKGT